LGELDRKTDQAILDIAVVNLIAFIFRTFGAAFQPFRIGTRVLQTEYFRGLPVSTF
jgi:hypothetical protein